MSTPSGPGRAQPDPSLSVIMGERRHLINLAYRLLGSLADAEDAVQETYARWYALPPEQQEAIRSPGAWLTTVASRICLDLLGSARARRERYVGEWLPEPLPEPAEQPGLPATADPADRVTLDESVTMAFLVVLETMTPAERVAFVLHDVFRYSFTEVAEIVGRTPAACRQLASSARRRLSPSPPAPAAPAHPRRTRDPTRARERTRTAATRTRTRDHQPGPRQKLQAGLGSQGHRRPHRPARPRRDRHRRRRRQGQRRAAPDRRRRAGRPLPGRPPRPDPRPDDRRSRRQRPARADRPAARRHRDGFRVRRHRRENHPHLDHPQPRQTHPLDQPGQPTSTCAVGGTPRPE